MSTADGRRQRKGGAPGGVQSVERVFELLELITDAGGEVTLSESRPIRPICPFLPSTGSRQRGSFRRRYGSGWSACAECECDRLQRGVGNREAATTDAVGASRFYVRSPPGETWLRRASRDSPFTSRTM